MWYIEIGLTEKGKKIFGSDTKTLEYDRVNKPSTDEVFAFINNEFVTELVDSVSEPWSDYSYLKKDDIIKIVKPNKDGTETFTFGEVRYIVINGCEKEIVAAEIHDIENFNNRSEVRFNFAGKEIGGSRKYKRYFVIPTAEEVQRYNDAKHKMDIYDEIIDLIRFHDDWDNLVIPAYLTIDMLRNIKNILKDAYDNYYGLTN